MEITEFEKKRAANLIWNGAHDYTIDTGFRVYDFEGRAQLYWNSIVGAVHAHYDWEKLMRFYRTFEETIGEELYESIFWIALENCTYEWEKSERPVLPYLRRQYAEHEIAHHALGVSDDNSAVVRSVSILLGHLHHILGEPDNIPDPVDAGFLAAIELGAEPDTDGVIAALTKALEKYTIYRDPATHGGRKELLPKVSIFHLFHKNKKANPEIRLPVRRLSFGYGEHVDAYGSEALDPEHLAAAFAQFAAQSDTKLAEYITDYFGTSIYHPKETARLVRAYCYGNHRAVKLHFTSGDYTNEMLERGYAGKMHRLAIEQAKINEATYHRAEARHRLAVDRLAERLRNSILTHLDDEERKALTGRVAPERIWRAMYVNDGKVFDQTIPGDTGDITIDLLLDASGSQQQRTQVVAAQGYMIAEALTRVGIPCRVASFCSLSGYTVFNLFRDYSENDKNREIFRFFTTGANRDGLAVRIAAGWMRENHAEHRILIILSDCQPNDVVPVPAGSGAKPYAAGVGVEDTAAEVHAARQNGIDVLCVFTGEDNNLPNVHRIYGRDFTRIRSLDMFADAVGRLIEERIRLI